LHNAKHHLVAAVDIAGAAAEEVAAVAMAAEVAAVAMAAEVAAVAMAAEVAAVAMAAEVATPAMSMVAKDAMAVETVEEVLGAIDTAATTTTPDMVETEGAVAMAQMTYTAAAAAAAATSRHTVFKARWFSIF
jgi:hypothetical protein